MFILNAFLAGRPFTCSCSGSRLCGCHLRCPNVSRNSSRPAGVFHLPVSSLLASQWFSTVHPQHIHRGCLLAQSLEASFLKKGKAVPCMCRSLTFAEEGVSLLTSQTVSYEKGVKFKKENSLEYIMC